MVQLQKLLLIHHNLKLLLSFDNALTFQIAIGHVIKEHDNY
jgi:hypothetical protein